MVAQLWALKWGPSGGRCAQPGPPRLPGGLWLPGTSPWCQAAPPSSHPILVAVFGAERVPGVPCCSAAGRGRGRGVHGRRDPKGLVTQDSVTGWRASGQQGEGEESRL